MSKNYVEPKIVGDNNNEMIDDLIYNKLIYSKESLSFFMKFSNIIIEICFKEIKNKTRIQILNKIRMRNITFFSKSLKNDKILKTKIIIKKELQKIFSQFFISFNKKIYILLSKYKKEKNQESNLSIKNLNYLLKLLLKISGIYYILGIINDDFFELLIKNTLNFSFEISSDKKENNTKDLTNIMFFNECILILKIIFNKLYSVEKKYSERQQEIIKNIIIHININLFGSSFKDILNYHPNKCLLYKNDYKTSLLIDLAHISTKMKSTEISKYLIDLLTNIYFFSFNYENSMKPILKLIESLVLNLNNKELDEIESELKLSGFTLDYINELNNKENILLKNDSCIIKQGFYLGNEISYIYGDVNSNLENDFVIFFSFRLESVQLNNVVLFELYNENKTQIKFTLMKNKENNYEMHFLDDSKDSSTKIIIQSKITYIFSFIFVTEGLFRHKAIKIKYIKDEKGEGKEFKNIKINSCSEAIKSKNIDNIKKICIGCERIKGKTDKFENQFKGYIGDFIILNVKKIKESIDSKIFEDILKLKQNYSYILTLLSDNINKAIYADNSFHLEYNSTFNKIKNDYENLQKKVEFKTNFTINTIISIKYFKLIEYQDELDFINPNINYDCYLRQLATPKSIKLIYLNYKIKSDSNNKKCLTINSSVFNNKFHTFEFKYSLIEFVKYEGIHYLSLLFEYLYQILCFLSEKKDKIEKDNLKQLYNQINEKITKIIKFLYINIINTNLYEYNLIQIEQFFYQMAKTIFKFVEVECLDFETIKFIVDIINSFDKKTNTNNPEGFQFLSLIKIKLIEIVINPRIYNDNDDFCLKKLNYVFLDLLTSFQIIKVTNFRKFYNKENFDMLLSFLWLLDEPKKKDLFEETKINYISVIVLFIQISVSLLIEEQKNVSSNKIEEDEKINKIKKSSSDNINENEQEIQDNLLINILFKKFLEYRINQYIFYNLSLILVKTNLICLLQDKNIENAKILLIKENYNGESINTEYKKIIYLSYLQILVSYYFSELKNKNQAPLGNIFNDFINNLKLDMDLFYAFIALFRDINKFKKINQVDLNSYKNEEPIKITKNDYPSFSQLPVQAIQIENLNDTEIIIINNIFIDILILLEKLEKSSPNKIEPNKINEKDEQNINLNKEINNGKVIFEIIKKNIDIIFKYPKTKLYEIVFSSESNICRKLFEIKWKYGSDKDINYIMTSFKEYYQELCRNNLSPFIFKFLLEISTENIFMNESKPEYSNINNTVSEFKAEIIIFIIETLNNFSKEIDKSKENLIFYYYNLLNCLIILNEELLNIDDLNNKQNILFNNKKLCEMIYIFIDLIAKGPLYSNICIEFKNKNGKIISEIIFDLLLAIPKEYFNKKIFIHTLIKSKEKMTIFYVIDLCKEKITGKKKVKNTINFLELNIMKEFNNIILSKKKWSNLVEENKIYQIDEANFIIYFLAKGFVYLREFSNKDKEKNIKYKTLDMFISCLADDLYSLYTRNKIFYVTKNCGFLLYDETKKYFESYLIQNCNTGVKNSDLFQKFFDNDLVVIIKDEYNLKFCYSSRLNTMKNIGQNKKKTGELIDNKNNESEQKNMKSIENETKSENSPIYTFSPANTFKSNPNMNNVEIPLDNKEIDSKIEEIKIPDQINVKEFINSFEIVKENSILNPRKFFFNIIFSDIYKDITFYNKSFDNIKKLYLAKYNKKDGIQFNSKQKNYPTRQKNYSNFLEPRLFLKRDYKFYDKIYFPISFGYIPKSFMNQKLNDLYFYQCKIKFDKKNIKFFVACELVTTQYIYFGNLYFYDNYIFFETIEDPRNDANKTYDLDILFNYSISTKSIDKYDLKYKFKIIFYKNIIEILKRRTLLLTQSLEIYLKNGKSYFFNFFKIKKAKQVYDFFNEVKKRFSFNFDLNDNQKDIKNIISQFHNGKISNYDYLLYLNKYSTRTYNDLSQYPVFPWLFLKFNNFDKIDEKSDYLRILKYPLLAQTETQRAKCIDNYKNELNNFKENEEEEEDGEKEYPCHFRLHYSNSAYIYFYLMRLNPYCRGMIKLQGYQNENPNRIFSSYKNIEFFFEKGIDNRELIPDFFCYFDFLLNLNCCFFGEVKKVRVNDDFILELDINDKNKNVIIPYVLHLYTFKKLLNSIFISKKLHEWVDNIFGKNQFFDVDNDEAEESCNIYNKYCYEQRNNFENELDEYEKTLRDKKHEQKELIKIIKEFKSNISYSINFGMTPKYILKSTILFEEENKITLNEVSKSFEDKLIYFDKISNEEYLFLKENNKKDKYKQKSIGLYVTKNKTLIENKIYECKGLNLMKKYKNFMIDNGNRKVKIPLYNPCYCISYLELKTSKKIKFSNIIILSCRYLGNYFNVQNIDNNINIFCEDFVTCIKANTKDSSNNFYTGLFNGKLIEWEIKENFDIKEIKHIYSHGLSITLIEIYERQNIIITASEDKFIHIRKQYDFELLTAIDLNYDYSNGLKYKNSNLFPSLVKISDLNLLYVLLYDLDYESNFIRGYNLNGLLFAQTEENLIQNEKYNKIIINSISFTKNSNLIIGFYNLNKYILLQSWDLNVYHKFDINDKKNRDGTIMITYDPYLDIFNLLYDNEYIRKAFNENDIIDKY